MLLFGAAVVGGRGRSIVIHIAGRIIFSYATNVNFAILYQGHVNPKRSIKDVIDNIVSKLSPCATVIVITIIFVVVAVVFADESTSSIAAANGITDDQGVSLQYYRLSDCKDFEM